MHADGFRLVKSKEGIEFYLSDDYNEQDLARCQQKSVQMMKIIVDVFEKHDIDYMLAHGTLLGLIRHNGFIPWDDDCDLFVFDWDYARAIELLRRELPDWMIVHNRRTDPIYWPKWTKIRDIYSDTYESLWKIDRKFKYHGICVDVLRVSIADKYSYLKQKKAKELKKNNMENTVQGKLALFFLKVLNRISKAKICIGNKGTIIECSFEYSDVFPLKKMTFLDVEVSVPQNPDGVLTSMYGDYRKLPELEERKPHFEKVVFIKD